MMINSGSIPDLSDKKLRRVWIVRQLLQLLVCSGLSDEEIRAEIVDVLMTFPLHTHEEIANMREEMEKISTKLGRIRNDFGKSRLDKF